jgi:hypothetical protein
VPTPGLCRSAALCCKPARICVSCEWRHNAGEGQAHRIAFRAGILLCGQGAASVKHVARYNNSATSAVAFPAYRNEANLAPGSGCCHFCTLDYKRAQSARRKKRRCERVLRGIGVRRNGGCWRGAAVGLEMERRGVECVWRWWCAGETGNRFVLGRVLAAEHCILNPRLPVVVMGDRKPETETLACGPGEKKRLGGATGHQPTVCLLPTATAKANADHSEAVVMDQCSRQHVNKKPANSRNYQQAFDKLI